MRYIKIIAVFLPLVLLAQSCGLGSIGGISRTNGGVIKSVDSGESWALSGKLSSGAELSGASFARFRIDNSSVDNQYLASPTNGVYQSLDRAATWNRILNGPLIYDIQINPTDSDELIAGGKVGQLAKIFKSIDRGKSWLEIFSESKPGAFVSAIGYFPKNPKTILAGLSTGEVIQSTNSGISWNLRSKITGRVHEFEFSSTAGVIRALSFTKGMFQSNNGGVSWDPISSKIIGSSFQDFVSLNSNYATIYLASYDGLYRTTDGGAGWQKLLLPLHEGTNTISAVAVNQKNSNEVYAVIAQTLYKSVDAGSSWQTHILPVAASVREIVIDTQESNTLYAVLGQILQ